MVSTLPPMNVLLVTPTYDSHDFSYAAEIGGLAGIVSQPTCLFAVQCFARKPPYSLPRTPRPFGNEMSSNALPPK